MRSMDFGTAMARYEELLDSVVADREEVVITRPGREPVVMLALSEYEALMETAHLLRSPANALRLSQAIERLEARHEAAD